MNRLAPPTAAEFLPDQLLDAQQVSPCAFSSPARVADDATAYATFAPMHYEERYAYPLVVWLHGAAGHERELRRVMPQVSMRNAVAIAPRGTVTDPARPELYSWQQTVADIEDAEERVFHCIDVARDRFHVNPDRIFLAGYGPGGTMALRLAWNQPRLFAGVASIMGRLPEAHCPLRRVNEIRGLPFLLASGLQSTAYDEGQVCRDLRLLHTAGFTVALRQYVCGDELMTDMLSDLNEWMMEIVCGNAASSSDRVPDLPRHE